MKIIKSCSPFVVFLGSIIAYLFFGTSAAWLFLVVSTTFNILIRMDDLTEFSLGPVRAKLRQKITEADETIKEVRKLGLAIGQYSLTHLVASSFMAGMPARMRYELYETIERALTELGIENSEMRAVKADWVRGVSIIYVREIGNRIQASLPKEERNEFGKKWNSLGDFSKWETVTPEGIRRFLIENTIEYQIEKDQLFLDYSSFKDSGAIPDVNRLVNHENNTIR